MEVLFFAFANNRENPLKTLTDEYAAVSRALSARVLRQHFLAWSVNHARTEDIAYYLTLFRDSLRLFLFSGHAGRDLLLAEDGAGNSAGIAHLLKQCSQLKVVVLNGCSTAAQVKQLHVQGVPLVIATHAPVEDEAATRFSMRLFQALETGLTIGEAFEQAIGEVMSIRQISVHRDVGGMEELIKTDAQTPLWGIFEHPEMPEARQWKLPSAPVRPTSRRYYPNDLLLDSLYETFSATNKELAAFKAKGATLDETKEEIVTAILKSLPAPISEQLRKLIAPSPPGITDGWDIAGPKRLIQLSRTYQMSMDFLVFTLMAELWENILTQRQNATLPLAIQKEIKEFIHFSAQERRDCDYISLIRVLREALKNTEGKLFVSEFYELGEIFLADENLKQACFFLENLRRLSENAGMMQTDELCDRAEQALCDLFKHLGFLARYILATVRNIDVQKYRHTPEALFEHLVVKWHGTLGFYDKEYRRQSTYMDNRSVILLRIDEAPGNNFFLNLSPFIIDENTFESVPDLSLSKLYFFDRRETERLFYKYVNDPETDIIDLEDDEYYDRKKKASKFQLANTQFDAFLSTLEPASAS